MAPTSPNQPKRLSCVNCRQRKIKCNRLDPCDHCQKAGIECKFPTPLRVKGAQRARNAEITNRLSRLEGLLVKLNGGEAEEGSSSATASHLPSIVEQQLRISREQPSRRTNSAKKDPILKPDGSRYLGDDLWTSVGSEVDGLRQLLEEDSEDDEDGQTTSWTSRTSEPVTAHPFFFNVNNPPVDLRHFHPYPPLITMFCDIYFARFDPCFKILHQPTVRDAFQKAADNLDGLKAIPAQEALMFALYLAVITSLPEEECKPTFYDERHVLLARYKHATELALANADFLNSQDLMSLQAFITYVLCIRCSDEGRTAWALVSLAARIAHAMDLPRCERPGPGRTLFEVEQRRRLWWGIILVEGCLCEDRGTKMTTVGPGNPAPRLVANVNDSDLSPDMTAMTIENRNEWTDLTFPLSMYEVAVEMGTIFHHPGQGSDTDLETKLLQAKKQIETKYLSLCIDPRNPLQFLASIAARCAVLRMWLLIYYPRHNRTQQQVNRPRPTKAALLAAALAHLELTEVMHEDPSGTPFRWFLTLWNPWYPLVVALAELCRQTTGPVVERAWRLLEGSNLINKWGAKAADTQRGALWTPVRKLLGRARSVRAAALAARGDSPHQSGVKTASGKSNPASEKSVSDVTSSTATAADVTAAIPPAAVVDTTRNMAWDLGTLVPADLAPVVQEETTSAEPMVPTPPVAEGLPEGMEGLDTMEGVESDLLPAWVDWNALGQVYLG